MTGFYNLTDKIKDTLAAEPFVNTVTYGSLDDVDLNKRGEGESPTLEPACSGGKCELTF